MQMTLLKFTEEGRTPSSSVLFETKRMRLGAVIQRETMRTGRMLK